MDSPVRQILLVEDEPLIAMVLETIVSEAGYSPIGPAADRNAALALLETRNVDAAILDYRLGEESADLLADELDRRRIPWLLATGFDRQALPDRYLSAPVVAKPFGEDDVRAALERLLLRNG